MGLLYDRYAFRAYSLARRICCEAGLAEEAVQNAFLVLWQAPSRYDPRAGSFATWLMAVVHHKSVDLVRRERVRSRAALASAEEQEWQPPLGPDMAALATGRAERVQAALRRLPEAQRVRCCWPIRWLHPARDQRVDVDAVGHGEVAGVHRT